MTNCVPVFSPLDVPTRDMDQTLNFVKQMEYLAAKVYNLLYKVFDLRCTFCCCLNLLF